MTNTVTFRDLEERDIDFIYKCKNDEKLNSMIVGQFKPFSYEDAAKWVHGCMGNHETFKFWAIATNDDEKRIVGWVSISNIDKCNLSASFHGIVIGDKDYHDGFAWIETYLFVYEYCFEHLKLNRVSGKSIVGHKQSNMVGSLFFAEREGTQREAVFKNGIFYDVYFGALLKKDYMQHKEKGDYEIKAILKRISQYKKNNNYI